MTLPHCSTYKNIWKFFQVSNCTACAGLVLLVALEGVARAEVDFNPLGRVSADHNSNVFQRPVDEPPYGTIGNTRLSDTLLRYLAGGALDLTWGLDRLRLSAQ